MSWVDLFPRGPYSIDVEQQLLRSRFAEFLQKKLDISRNHMKIEVLLEYALAFFLYPHFTGTGPRGTLGMSSGKDSKAENVAWIEAVIRPRLLEHRKENIITLFNARFEGENEESLNPTEIWHHLITILSERYTLPDAAILVLTKDNVARDQYTIASESSVVLMKKNDAKPEKTVMETLLLILTLFVQPDIKLDAPVATIAWANYWFHLNNSVVQSVQDLRSAMITKTKLEYVHPEILKLVLNEIRGINTSGVA